ncbi:hypothetical protein [Marixanthomonas ophiurae]|uniref:Uncharacterized protein n=1 Tax=Marixanthomonas ophiurae TaxID=387659 RepID=A0A3E1QAB6_9FLAO|nr:hypothetical protein [Marixanthomonas ophiurae]RFN59044.1 hypothetical protein DZ858_02900 [Marixanthomonas ophiurae]
MFNTAFLSILKKRFILSLAVLYLIVPLHQSLSEGFHKLSHALTHTSANHHHDLEHELDKEHTHEHKAIAFFNNLFSADDTNSDKDALLFEIKYDKHITQEYFQLKPVISPQTKHTFTYHYGKYCTSLSVQTPPPRVMVS